MIKNNLKKGGFSLVEVIIYVAIFSLLLYGMMTFLDVVSKSRFHNQEVSEVNYQGMKLVRMISHSIRNAEEILSPVTSQTSSTLSVVGTGGTVTYSIVDGVLMVTEDGGNPVPLTNNHVRVEDLTFTNLSATSTPGIVQIRFTLSSLSDTFTKNFYASASIR
jgi:type II secretory pathway pseudopilin PulG